MKYLCADFSLGSNGATGKHLSNQYMSGVARFLYEWSLDLCKQLNELGFGIKMSKTNWIQGECATFDLDSWNQEEICLKISCQQNVAMVTGDHALNVQLQNFKADFLR